MTSFFTRYCSYPGCKNTAVAGKSYCSCHLRSQAKQSDMRRGTRTERGYTNTWLRASKTFLTQHPLCIKCQEQNRITPATEVDHIIPHKGDKKLFWDQNNWQALCHECHSRKTATEDGGFGNKVITKATN